MLGKKGSKILKLPSVRNCFTLAITYKLVVIINSLKVPKIKKILLYDLKFPVPNYSCLQNPLLGGCRPQIPIFSVLCPQLNLLNPPEQNKPLNPVTMEWMLCCPLCLSFRNILSPSAQFFINLGLQYVRPHMAAYTNLPEDDRLTVETCCLFVSCGAMAQRGPWPPHSWGF